MKVGSGQLQGFEAWVDPGGIPDVTEVTVVFVSNLNTGAQHAAGRAVDFDEVHLDYDAHHRRGHIIAEVTVETLGHELQHIADAYRMTQHRWFWKYPSHTWFVGRWRKWSHSYSNERVRFERAADIAGAEALVRYRESQR